MTSSPGPAGGGRVTAVLRHGETVTPLELFFDLVFVLAITQCTALIAVDPTWAGVARALLVLAVLWWAWAGYAWLTSVVDPEEGVARIAMFIAMAALLVCAMCIPRVFDDLGLLFAGGYAVVLAAHIVLFLLASRGDPGLRRSTLGLAVGAALSVGLIAAASSLDGVAQGAIWAVAVVVDVATPLVWGADGWHLVPAHFAERHGLIVIIALGESIVAIGLGAGTDIDAGVVVAAVLGVAVAAALWWLYFDLVALVAARRLEKAAPGRERNEIARDAFTYLHYPMIAGIVLIALGLKKTLGHVGDPLHIVPAAALLGGAALYLVAHVAFRWRNIRRISWQRLAVALLLAGLVPAGAAAPALATLATLAVVLIALVAFEVTRFGEVRSRLRRELRH